MVSDVIQLLHAAPFEAFQIVTSSGTRYRVTSADHANVNPQRNRVVVWFNDDSSVTLWGLHIAAVEKEAPPKAEAA
ncbi:MAG: hypothetical protein C5B50_04700 [Verrucomicrobia bacterium]|nr:MAG: hypothetical protein C5B50_04700 [Verrucomicrobiota bacterium]